jgi:hypothetical protein
MAFMKRNSPIRTSQLKRSNSDIGPSVQPKKRPENLDCQQPSEQISSVQITGKSVKTTKTPNKLVKPVGNSKKPLTVPKPSPYSYSTKKVCLPHLL